MKEEKKRNKGACSPAGDAITKRRHRGKLTLTSRSSSRGDQEDLGLRRRGKKARVGRHFKLPIIPNTGRTKS